jgi:RND superfamily putative drug exporter
MGLGFFIQFVTSTGSAPPSRGAVLAQLGVAVGDLLLAGVWHAQWRSYPCRYALIGGGWAARPGTGLSGVTSACTSCRGGARSEQQRRALTSPNGHAIVAIVYPATSPQATQTISLVDNLRTSLIPQAARGTGLIVHVGGETATNIDFSQVLGDKLPVFIAVVVILAFLLLAAVFRSLLIPLTAAVLNLLSVGAALGALNAVFNWGWGASLLGLTGTGPIDAFLPVIMFSVLFGLSMDYEVFTVSRMQEEWRQSLDPGDGLVTSADRSEVHRNHLAVTLGQAKSSRVIIAAASIMILVFGSFLLGGHRLLQEFGFGLAFSVLVDALVIRSLLLPAVMHLIGPANWALPNWLGRVLPRFSIERGHEDPEPRIGDGIGAVGTS